MPNKFTKVSLQKEKVQHFGEHEILLSFHDDIGAEIFDQWWHIIGARELFEWMKNKDEFEWYCEEQ